MRGRLQTATVWDSGVHPEGIHLLRQCSYEVTTNRTIVRRLTLVSVDLTWEKYFSQSIEIK